VFVDPAAPESAGPEGTFGFTRYFRCQGCDAGGPWGFPALSLARLMLLMNEQAEGSKRYFFPGRLTLFDGTTIRNVTEGEDYLKRRIALDPGNYYLWGRLGNLYRAGKRPDLACSAYRKAIELDPGDVESHHSLGEILFDEGDLVESARHLRRALGHAWERKDLSPEMKRSVVRSSLLNLVEIEEETGGYVKAFASASPMSGDQNAGDGEEEELVVALRALDLSDEADLEELVSVYLREDRLPRWRRRLVRQSAFSSRGTSRPPPTRNAPCPCGSGRKHKNCCGRKG